MAVLVISAARPGSASSQNPPTRQLLPENTLLPRILADSLEGRFMVLEAVNDPFLDVGLGDLWDIVRWEGAQSRAGFDRAAIGGGGAAIMQFLIQHDRNVNLVTLPFGFREITGFDLVAGDYYVGGVYLAAEREGRVRSRVRIHLNPVSAHPSDGLYDAETSSWSDGRVPVRYSRESLQILVDVETRSGFRAYAEGSRLYLHGDLAGGIFRWLARRGAGIDTRRRFPSNPG